jgi:hypothetical protein
MFATLGFGRRGWKGPDGMLEKGDGLVRFLETGPAEDVKPHNKPCRMKGNASVWRPGHVLC